jgi:multiple sugar transport system ATP-binding protein
MVAVVLDKVSKTFFGRGLGRRPRPAIPPLDLQIEDGEFLVLVGPSGCGKTTLLRIIAGLEDATSGEVYFDGRRVTQEPPAARNLAFVFQSPALYPHLTIAENLDFPLRTARMAEAERKARVGAVAELLKLGDQLAKWPRQLSGGQRQRAAMGRAIIRDPDLFLFDEPLSNLDALLRVELRAEIAALQREIGRTTVYVTHDGEEAMTMGQRVAVLRDGALQQIGTPAELYSNPANAFVAGFVGNPQMNFVPGQVWYDGTWQLAFGAVRMTLPPATVARHLSLFRREGRSVIVGFRPETVAIDSETPDPEALEVEVSGVQHLGKEARVLFRAPDVGVGVGDIPDLDRVTSKIGRAGELTMTLSPPQPVTWGEALRLRIDPLALHLFDSLGQAL